MKIVVIIPTYNEAGSIRQVLATLQSGFARMPQHEWHILIVDGNSPDGTASIVAQQQASAQNLHLIVEEKKRGIAAAYATGIIDATARLSADAYVEFDGDGQHDPQDVPRLIEEIENGYDYVIGSRYVAGGSVPREWALYRKLLSRLGSLYARVLLELPVYDATSGFKATRVRGAAESLPLGEGELLSRQYAYKLQFMYHMARSGATIKEIPIAFLMREHDISKSAWYDILESLRVTLLLRFYTLKEWRLLRVIGVSAFGLLVQAVIFEIIAIRLHVFSPSTVVLMAGEVGVFLNFFMHERFSFEDKKGNAAPMLRRLGRFHIISFASILIQWLMVHAAQTLAPDSALYLRVAYLTGVALGFCVIYLGAYFWVWSKRRIITPAAS